MTTTGYWTNGLTKYLLD